MFREFECVAIRTLLSPRLPAEIVDRVLDEAEFVSFDHTVVGYFVTVRHPSLPIERAAFNEPSVSATSGDLDVGFIAFVENWELMLECHVWGDSELPSDVRDRTFEVRVDADWEAAWQNELDRRAASFAADPTQAEDWDVVRARLMAELRGK